MPAPGVLAATLVKPGEYEIREYPLPDPAPGCVLVRMEMSGICGTDKHTFQGFTTQYGGRKLEFPIIQGHENVGTVAAIGGNGKFTDFEGDALKVGDRVVVGANVACGECYYCRARFSLLLLRKHHRLWEQFERKKSAVSFWRMVAIYLCSFREVFW